MMNRVMMSKLARLAIAGVCAVAAVTPLAAQAGRAGQRQAPGSDFRGGDEAGVTPGEIQRMFDAYALLQAQEQLKISDDQFNRFLTRFKALQEVRRQSLQERGRLITTLRTLANAPQPDEAQIKERLTALQDLETRTAADLKKAYDAIDQLLDIRQQAKFRVFEEMMERRKLELVMRARQRKQPKL
jgi:Spy/CpxP family protein refolding chaperone